MNQKKRILLAIWGTLIITSGISYWWVTQRKSPHESYVDAARTARRQRLEAFISKQKQANSEAAGINPTLKFFDINTDFRLNAQFIREEVIIGAEQLQTPGPPPAGKVQFEFQGKSYQLIAYWYKPDEYDELFVPFRDPTNQQSLTYEGGRYLYADLKSDQSLVLDFNLCENPYCAFSPLFVCPLPPKENTLPFAVSVGEKKPE
jgi:uncharacterized protein